MKISTVIFDMDDLMINSHPVNMKGFEAFLQEHGASMQDPANPLSRKEEAALFGRRRIEVFEFLAEKYGLHGASFEEMDKMTDRVANPIFEEHAEPMPGLFELVSLLKREKYRLVLASSAKKEKIGIILKKFRLEKAFDAVVSGVDVKRGKPDPDIFLKAAESISAEPKKCVVLEDARNGVMAAKSAGMRCIGVHNQFAFKRLGIRQDLSGADLQVNSLEEIDMEKLSKI